MREEFDRYYVEEHFAALSKVPGWLRTRRFVTSSAAVGTEQELLALHDYLPENGLAGKDFKAATTTEWYNRMMKDAVKNKVRRTYVLKSISSP
jgi:hypothetical protein